MASYYDLVLGLIPLVLVGGTGALLAIGFHPTTAVPLAAFPVAGLMGHAMFVRGPGDREAPPDESDAAGFHAAD